MPPRLIAIIPAFQEADRVGPVVRAAAAHLPVVVVDDGSTDGTAEVAEAAGATVLRQVPNQGKGAALRCGFRHALATLCNGAVTLDADGQHDPAEIPRFLAAFTGGAETGAAPDLVVGARDFSRMPPVRRLSNSVGRLVFSWAVGRSIPDNQSGYRLLSDRLMAAMLTSDESGFAFEVEMLARCVGEDRPIAWVPIRTIYAGAPSHIRPLAHVREFFAMAWRARRLVRSGRPR